MTINNPHKILGLGPRCAGWLRQQYPKNRGKLIARDFRVHENTAWRWLSGVAPTSAHLEEMYGRWGRPWLEFVFVEAFQGQDRRIQEMGMIDIEIERQESVRQLRVQSAPSIVPSDEEIVAARDAPDERVRYSITRRAGPTERRTQILIQLAKEVPRPSFALGRRLTSAVVGAFRTFRHSNRVTAWLGPGPE